MTSCKEILYFRLIIVDDTAIIEIDAMKARIISNVVTFILAGGVGVRLHPLTKDRAKPAVPFGGKYRIIDFTLSNCVNSGIRQIFILPQYKSYSLERHTRDAWSVFNPELGEFVTHLSHR